MSLDQEEEYAWYILRITLGQEQAILDRLARRFFDNDLWQPDMELVVPTDIISGCLLLRMVIDSTTWTTARITDGVTGFVGSGDTPTPFYEQDWHDIPLERWIQLE